MTAARDTIEGAIELAYRDARNAGHGHETALVISFDAVCAALGIFVARSAKGSLRELEHNLLAVSSRVEVASRKAFNEGSLQRHIRPEEGA